MYVYIYPMYIDTFKASYFVRSHKAKAKMLICYISSYTEGIPLYSRDTNILLRIASLLVPYQNRSPRLCCFILFYFIFFFCIERPTRHITVTAYIEYANQSVFWFRENENSVVRSMKSTCRKVDSLLTLA